MDTAPSRSIVYHRHSDGLSIPLEVFVTGEDLNKDLPEDQTTNYVVCSGLILDQEPTKLDYFTLSGRAYTVRRWGKIGELYSVRAENAKRNKVTGRKFS